MTKPQIKAEIARLEAKEKNWASLSRLEKASVSDRLRLLDRLLAA